MNFLQRLFSQPKAEPTEPVQEAAPEEPGFVTEEPSQPAPAKPDAEEKPADLAGLAHLAPGLHLGKLSDVGRQRERNEDTLYALESIIDNDSGLEPFGLFIVADGMGGHQKGEVASALAARITANSLLKDIYLPYLTSEQNANTRPINEALQIAVQNANEAVQEQAPDGGTTLTAAVVMGNSVYLAHVGDTRAYIFKSGKLKQITQDHSLAQRLSDLGQATAEEAKQVQNVLYRAIGQNQQIEVDTHIQHLPAGASLLVCSDGLWGQVEDESIKAVLETASSPQAACETLIQMANENGGPDNITVILVSNGNDGSNLDD